EFVTVSAVTGETAELPCSATLRTGLGPALKSAWYRCQNISECTQLIGTVTPTLKCLSSNLRRFHFRDRRLATSEHCNISVVISDLHEDDAGFYKCVMSSQQQILNTQQVYLQIKPEFVFQLAPTVDSTSTKGYASPTRASSSVAETFLISIAIAVWLGVTAVLLFLCLYGRHLYLNS
ncbi:hypothetical protein NFI96_010542, partial [Prochilodus magdalenae]